ncbi:MULTISPECIES: hypothetical protein [Nonomuraea]|uniref:Uncharacterized protein n=1 Tax=Nonomuraea mangrovi TaxID=2316207 RepID=A0ABW4T951_9ACTN
MNARRVVVPRRPAAVQRAPVPLGLDGPDSDAEVRALMGRQARHALVTVAAVAAVLVALPLLTAEGDWLLVTLAVQPLWVVLAVFQLRRAERAEREP